MPTYVGIFFINIFSAYHSIFLIPFTSCKSISFQTRQMKKGTGHLVIKN